MSSIYAVTVDEPEIKCQGFGGGPLVGGGPGARAPWAPLKSGPDAPHISLSSLPSLCHKMFTVGGNLTKF